MDLYLNLCREIARLVTKQYSTSFYLSSCLLQKETREAIFAVYAFVRFADEIVDSFHDFDKEKLLLDFEQDMKKSLQERISVNPVLNTFQNVVHRYNIPYELIDAFMQSMKADLSKQVYNTKEETENYIYGSANVVGLMCLKVFVVGDELAYQSLKGPAMMLGSAFQKVNFLRDLGTDMQDLKRTYFSGFHADEFGETEKNFIIREIQDEFEVARKGISLIPGRSKLAVFTAYCYYKELLAQIASVPASEIMKMRVRVSDFKKIILLIKSVFMYKFKLI